MKILILDGINQTMVVENAEFIPQVGMKIDMGYKPYPTVNGVLLYPKEWDLKQYDAIISCN